MDAETRAAFKERYGYEPTWRDGSYYTPRTHKERLAWVEGVEPGKEWRHLKSSQLKAVYYRLRGKRG